VPLADFLAALFAGCEGFMEFRAFPSKARLFPPITTEPPRILGSFLAGRASENLYIGVSSRRDQAGGDLAHCRHLGALFADVDFKETAEPEARDRIARCPLRPSALVHSGGGLHIYYFLREPLVLSDDAERAKHLLRRLARVLGGDLRSAEAARILRVPGTRNHKPEYGAPRPVVLEVLDPAARYNLHELEEWLPEAPAVSARPGPFTMPEQVPTGTRNDTLYREARSLFARGFGVEEVTATLTVTNQTKCLPPLPADEVSGIIANAATQPHGHAP
jgi:RepB DNA-primase from phage plasmid/Primase C terminal 1 (PriCT-1)